MKLLADSGSTKTDWCIIDAGNRTKITTQGINPYHQSEEQIEGIIRTELFPQLKEIVPTLYFDKIEYYGAGCTKEKIEPMKTLLGRIFGSCGDIIVDSDMLGACKVLCNASEGIACILGTGANSCLYDGEKIVQNVSPMGFIVGDEGSGAVIGKMFIGEIYKGEHRDLLPTFERETGLSAPVIISRVYREPMPNRFLASLNPFINKHKEDNPWIKDMIIECFCMFFRRNIRHYNRRDLPVNFVGSIAYYYKEELSVAALREGYMLGKVIKTPL